MYDLGDPVPLRVEVRDAAGALANATSVVVTITLPDTTTSTPAVTNSATGIYTASGPSALEGRYTVRWVATGTNASAYTDVYDVRSASPIQLFSLAEARSMLRLSSTAEDEELRTWIDATTAAVERITGPVIPRQFTETLLGRRAIVLSHPPVISVDTIVPTYVGGWSISIPDLVVDVDGIVTRVDRADFSRDWYTVTYTAGRRVIPPAILAAGRIILKNLWETQRAQTRQPGVGGGELPPAGSTQGLIPYRAQNLLEAYRQAGTAA